MGSVRPARRFDALRALAGPGLPSRLSPDGGPPCAFAPLQRSIAAPPHRPADPKARMADDASSPGLSCPTTHAGRRTRTRGASRLRGVPRPGFEPPSRRPPPSLPRLSARSVLGLRPPRLSPRGDRDSLRSPMPSWRSPRRFASPPGERADAAAYRASIPPQARSALPDPEGPGASMPSWAFSLQSAHPPALATALCSRGDPLARVGRVRRPDPPASQGLEARKTWPPLSGRPALMGFVAEDRRDTA